MDYLEPEYKDAYETWEQDKTPKGNSLILGAIDPVVRKGTSMYGGVSPLSRSRARKLALEGLGTYDRSRSRLQSHLINQLKGLHRISKQQQEVVRAPERVLLDRFKLQRYEQDFLDETGRDATDDELSNQSGFSLKRIKHIRGWHPGMTSSQLEAISPNLAGGQFSGDETSQAAWLEVVYDSLSPMDQKVMELSLGLHGRKALSNQAIAKTLKRTPGAISQRKKKIQEIIREEEGLSPFLR
jgi:DNA-directed RNA polymerase specialized sigma subunit